MKVLNNKFYTHNSAPDQAAEGAGDDGDDVEVVEQLVHVVRGAVHDPDAERLVLRPDRSADFLTLEKHALSRCSGGKLFRVWFGF